MDSLLLFKTLAEVVQTKRRPAALATVISTSGSVPQKSGAKMALFEDGSTLGTLGGGAIEQELIATLKDAMGSTSPFIHERHLTKELGMCCGGSMKFFIEPLTPCPRLILFGAGHISQSCAVIARTAGFEVHVVDDREELNDETHFPECVHWLEEGDDLLRREIMTLGAWDYIVICTHCHRLDERILLQCVAITPAYMGMIGSHRKVKFIRERVFQKNHNAHLEHLHAPIGIDLGAQEPGEIALSIVSQLVKIRRSKEKHPELPHAPRRTKKSIGIVLAAGAAKRLGSSKALCRINHETVLQSVVESLQLGGCSEVCIIVAAPHEAAIRETHPQYWYASNPSPESGMLGSVRIGLKAAQTRRANHIVVALLDQPAVNPNTIQRLLDAASHIPHNYIVPTFRGRRGHPFVLDGQISLEEHKSAATLRDALTPFSPPAEVAVEDRTILEDLDTPEDARRQGICMPLALPSRIS